MLKLVDFEGLDYSGKTTTLAHLSGLLVDRKEIFVNRGPVYVDTLVNGLLSVANQSDDLERERIYTLIMMLDKVNSLESYRCDERVCLQDRYWPSVVSYGRFLNREKSIHNCKDFAPFFVQPFSTIVLSCSREEMIARSIKRNRKSVLDGILLGNTSEIQRLEEEIERSLSGLPNIFRLDTSDKSVEEVGDEILGYLVRERIL